MGKALYLVVRHPKDGQSFVNSWLRKSELLEAITTTTEVAEACNSALVSGINIYVHRCGYSINEPKVCYSVKVAAVKKLVTDWFVEFKDQKEMSASPAVRPMPGQNLYFSQDP